MPKRLKNCEFLRWNSSLTFSLWGFNKFSQIEANIFGESSKLVIWRGREGLTFFNIRFVGLVNYGN